LQMSIENIFGDEYVSEEWEVDYYEYASYDATSKKTSSRTWKNY
jgi:hypothetical protein